MENRRILIIDDDPAIREDYRKILLPDRSSPFSEIEKLEEMLFERKAEDETGLPDFELDFASQGREGYELVVAAKKEKRPYAVAFVDIRMPPGWDGMETAQRIRQVDPDVEIVIVTAYSDRDRNSLLAAIGDPSKLIYLKKPFDPDEIRQLAHSLTEKWNLQFREREYRRYLENLLSLFSSVKLDAEHEALLVENIIERIVEFFSARAGAISVTYSGKDTHVAVHPAGGEGEPILEYVKRMPEGPELVDSRFLLVPLDLVKGKGTLAIDMEGSPVSSGNAVLLGGIIAGNIANICDVYHFQRALIEEQSLAAVGNAVYRIIHDLNNPVSAIIGFAALVEKSRNTNEKDLRRVKNILTAAENVRRIIDSLHDLISDDLHLDSDLLDVKEVVMDVVSEVQPQFEKAGVELVLDIPDNPVMNRLDREKLRRILDELLRNALEATEKGRGGKRVELSLSSDEHSVTLRVTDTGCGIPDEMIEKIWTPFFSYGKRNRLGLGLSLSRKFARLFGGELTIESELNSGTTATLALPIRG